MYPELFSIGPITITSFGTMIVIAFLSCNYLLRKDFIKYGYNPEYADDIIFRAALGGILGAKLYFLIENYRYANENISGLGKILYGLLTLNFQLVSDGIHLFGAGLVFLGGLIGGLILVSHYIYKKSLNWFVVADLVAPLIALGHGIGRIGCLLVGDDYGIPTDLPWGIAFPNGAPPSTAFNIQQMGCPIPEGVSPTTVLAVHPTQIYEMALYFLIFLFLKNLLTKSHIHGEIFANYLFLAGLARFVVEFIRLNPRYYLDLSGAQYISIIMMIFGIIFHYLLRKNKENEVI